MEEKTTQLKRFIKEKGANGVVVAFSGGVDSATLAAVCHEVLGEKAVAVTVKSAMCTVEEVAQAQAVAKGLGVKHLIVEADVLSDPNVARNTENRCFFCKKIILQKLGHTAQELGFGAIFEGTNLSDLQMHRPGYQAVVQVQNVYSPWVIGRFTKEEIRELAAKLQLSVHDKPANACLATRIAYNQPITVAKLERIAKAEQLIRQLTGAKQLRVRDHNGLARIEVDKTQRSKLCSTQPMDEIAEKLKQLGFSYVTLDLEGFRSGSMLQTSKKEPQI
ncbi:MAG: ATP-dependent sacrificial sulfur transferase LarE [Candidatus Bathyarchaeota archaeon]|nr:ATP-dependent sacrificial sulfur transferase LarE [Candidatus Bathyarchaeota archaeon]